MEIAKLLKLKKADINKLIKKHNIKDNNNILSALFIAENKKKLIGAGELEILADGYGFLRNSTLNNDIYISASQIKKLGLRNTDYITSEVREPLGNEKSYGILKVLLVNDLPIEKAKKRPFFDDLAPYYPDQKVQLGNRISCRIIDLFAPIGRGQRSLIVAPPKAGKTTLMSNLANGIIENNRDLDVWMLLIDERPEEVTDITNNVKGSLVFSSTFDEDPSNHIKVAEKVLEKAKRKVEEGRHIVILMDNITRLARAYNLIIPSSGKTISGGLDPYAFVMPKKFFGAARNIKSGGSLTILATALVDTGSRMDDVIYEEFKGTGNSEVHLSREAAQYRIFPAIDIKSSGTRKEELLVCEEKLEASYKLRRHLLKEYSNIEGLKALLNMMKREEDSNIMLYKFIKSS